MHSQDTRPGPGRSLPAEDRAPRVATIGPDEAVLIHLHQAPDEPNISWAGIVLRSDATAIRLETVWAEHNGQRYPKEGPRCIPWHRVDTVEIVALAETEVAS